MKTVRAKFKVDEIKRHHGTRQKLDADGEPATDKNGYATWESCEIRSVILSPVSGNGDPEHENTKFWNASPTGRIELGCANLAAAALFQLGAEYYIDFTPADPGPGSAPLD